ncbi:MAG: polymer-forming cytoskeletal protein [Pseudomonadota bacterium]|nr:polymer-forming cytoskeletal protein [Pseudomonadota bacterium]
MILNRYKNTLKKLSKDTSIVGFGTIFQGNLRCDNNVFVAGQVEGDIIATGKAVVEIGETGSVKGQVKGDYVLIYGTVEGDILALHQLEIGSTASVKGRLAYSLLKLEPGAVFEGELEHKQVDKGNVTEELAPAVKEST